MNNSNSRNFENEIISLLKKSDNDMDIIQVAAALNAHRVTISKYLAVMEAKGLVKSREIGRAKLYSINPSAGKAIAKHAKSFKLKQLKPLKKLPVKKNE